MVAPSGNGVIKKAADLYDDLLILERRNAVGPVVYTILAH